MICKTCAFWADRGYAGYFHTVRARWYAVWIKPCPGNEACSCQHENPGSCLNMARTPGK